MIALVMATMLEAEPFVDSLGLQQKADKPFPLYQSGGITLVISGMGKANAAIAAAFCCQGFRPKWICNLGAAGAAGRSCSLGAIYHVDHVVEYDRPHLRTAEPHLHHPHVLPGFRTATVATQDRPVKDAGERKLVSACANLVDMEAAGVAQACHRFDIRCVIFKFVSDTPDHSRSEQIVEHIRLHRQPFCEFFITSVLPILRTDKP